MIYRNRKLLDAMRDYPCSNCGRMDGTVCAAHRNEGKGMAVAKNFDHFRKEVVILAGFYEQTFDLEGNMKLEAKSISFASMEEPEFEAVYSAVMNVLLDKVFIRYAGRAEVDQVIDQIMRFA